MKNLKIQKIETIQKLNPNLSIPVGQIVLINVVNKAKETVQQEPLERLENELKDVDYLTKTKNTFTDKNKTADKHHEKKYTKHQEVVNDKLIADKFINEKQLNNIQNVKKTVKPNVYQTPRIIELKNNQQIDQNAIVKQANYIQNNKNANHQAPLPPQHNKQQLDRAGQLKQSTISLNHHYEQPDRLLSKKYRNL